MNHERNYNENYNRRDYGLGAEYENNNNNNNDNNNDDNNNDNNNIEMNSVDSWRLRTLYTDTKYVCAAKTDEILTCDKLFAHQNRAPTHPSSLPVILKDSSRPYTYYTAKSYGNAQEKNYYVNFDDHVSGSAAATPGYHNAFQTECETEYGTRASFDDSGCVKTYLCTILGCFVCCLFKLT
jgi:hypothetical protein